MLIKQSCILVCGLSLIHISCGVCQTDAGAVAARRAGSRPGEGCRDSGKGWKKPGRGSQNAAYCKDEAGYAEGAGTHRGSPGADVYKRQQAAGDHLPPGDPVTATVSHFMPIHKDLDLLVDLPLFRLQKLHSLLDLLSAL